MVTDKNEIAATGTSERSTRLSAAKENIWVILLAGLSRSQFGLSASGAKTNPPCAAFEKTATPSARNTIGAIHCTTASAVQEKIGVPSPISARVLVTSSRPNRSRQRPIQMCGCHASIIVTVSRVRAVTRSRERDDLALLARLLLSPACRFFGFVFLRHDRFA